MHFLFFVMIIGSNLKEIPLGQGLLNSSLEFLLLFLCLQTRHHHSLLFVTNFYFFHPNRVHLIPSEANDPQGLMHR